MQPIDDTQVFGLPLVGVVQRTGVEADGITIPRYAALPWPADAQQRRRGAARRAVQRRPRMAGGSGSHMHRPPPDFLPCRVVHSIAVAVRENLQAKGLFRVNGSAARMRNLQVRCGASSPLTRAADCLPACLPAVAL